MNTKFSSLFFLFLFSISIIYSQNQQKIDSLIILTSTAPVDSNLVDTYEQITKLYLRVQLDSAKIYAQKMIDTSEELGYDKGIAMGNNWLGEAYFLQGDYDNTLVCFNKTLTTFGKQGKTTQWANSLTSIANVYSMIGSFDTATTLYFQAIEYHNKHDDIFSESKALLNLARVYSRTGDFKKANKYFYQARLNFRELDNKFWLATTEHNIALSYKKLNNYDSAIAIYKKILKYYQSSNNYSSLGNVYSNLGVLYESQGNNKDALISYRKSLNYRKKINDQGGIAISEMNMSSLYLKKGKYDTALVLLESSRVILKKNKSIHPLTSNYLITGDYYLEIGNFKKAEEFYLNTYTISTGNNLKENSMYSAQMLSTVYEEMHDYKNSLKYAKIYKIQYDSLINEENIKEHTIAEEEYKHNFELVSKEKEISIEKQQKNYSIIIGASIVLFLILVIIYSRKLQKNNLIQIKQENEILIQKGQAKIQKAERKRLANMLHDNIAHVITISQRQINNLLNKNTPIETKENLVQIDDNLLLANRMIKIASYELEFSFVFDKNIVDQIRDYINRIRHSHSPIIKFKHSKKNQFKALSDEINETIFSVFQEMLGNAIKYSHAETIRITLLLDDGKIVLQVVDNGIGFDYDEVRHGLGFPNMKKRAEKLNGTFTFESEKGLGAKFRFVV